MTLVMLRGDGRPMKGKREQDKLATVGTGCEVIEMRSRIPMIWLAVLTIYQSYVTTDALKTLKSVDTNQQYTLQYMAKAAKILKKLRKQSQQHDITIVGTRPDVAAL